MVVRSVSTVGQLRVMIRSRKQTPYGGIPMMFRCTCLAVGSLLLSFAAAPVRGQEGSPQKDEQQSEIERKQKDRAGNEDSDKVVADSERAKSEREADAKHQRRQELERKLAELKRRVVELREAGKSDEAAAVEREARAIFGGLNAEADAKHQRRQEVEHKLAEMKRRIVELREAGKSDEAAAVEREARALSERFNAGAIEALRQQIEELRRTGRNQEAMKLEDLLRARSEQDARREVSEGPRDRRDRFGGGEPADLERRLAHLREAAENLMAAGMPEQADQLRRLAESMRERHGEPSERPSELRELHAQLRQQDERIQRLEQIVHRLAENLERQDAGRKRKMTEGPGPGDKRNDNEK
jgi:hypothetical protein